MYGCGKSGDCCVGARDSLSYCLHPRYCSRKVKINTKSGRWIGDDNRDLWKRGET